MIVHIEYGRRYNYGPEQTEVEVIGPAEYEDHVLLRVANPSFAAPLVNRHDVIRASPWRRYEAYYEFEEVVARSDFTTARAVVPEDSRGTPALQVFREAVEATGCVWAGVSAHTPRLAFISVPPGVSAEAWRDAHVRLLREMTGRTPEAYAADVQREKREAEAERVRRRDENDAKFRREVRRRERVANAIGVAKFVLLLGALIAGAVFAVRWALHNGPAAAARAIALAMLVGAVGVTVILRPLFPIWAPVSLAALAAYLCTRSGQFGLAAGAGLLVAALAGPQGVWIGIMSGFAQNSKQLRQVWGWVVLPSLLVALGGVLLLVTGIWATLV